MSEAERLTGYELYEPLAENGINYFCGVPDSVTGPFSQFLEENAKDRHVITANEGNAIGLAIGYHIATGEVPLVYMQNSGLSNAIDPLASLADRSVFGTPMILLIGWRGQPGKSDEAHHFKQGAITTEMLQSLGIPYDVLSSGRTEVSRQIGWMAARAADERRPYALLIEHDSLEEYQRSSVPAGTLPLSREEALSTVVENLDEDTIIVSGIGKISRELFEYRQLRHQGHDKDLLVVGGMGHASSVALGIAQQKPERKVVCLDGDGAVLMHLGALATIGNMKPDNFYHVLFNNGVHDSVGGQPTAARNIDIPAIAQACGYRHALSCDQASGISSGLVNIWSEGGPALLEVKIRGGARAGLSRPTITPASNKDAVMSHLG